MHTFLRRAPTCTRTHSSQTMMPSAGAAAMRRLHRGVAVISSVSGAAPTSVLGGTSSAMRSAAARCLSSVSGPPSDFLSGVDKLAPTPYFAHASTSNEAALGRTGECPFLASETNAVVARAAQRESNARSYVRKFPIAIAKGDGLRVTDTNGNTYLDCLQCAGTLALGHNHPVTTAAVADFMASGAPLQVLDMASPVKDEYVSALMDVTPEALSRVHFCSPAGTDALDAAVKLCKIATGRRTVLAFHGAYHGHGHGTLAMMGNLGSKGPVTGLMPDVHFVPFPYLYRNPFGIADAAAGEEAVLAYLATMLSDDESGITKPACLVMEAIQGEGGVNAMSPHALREVRRITREAGVPLVMDEVQAGFCRSGDFFAFEHAMEGAPAGATLEDYAPDVLCVSKAAGGSFPLAAILFSQEMDKWGPAAHTGTFRGNQIAFAAGAASIRYMQEARLMDAASARGAQLAGRVRAVADKESTQGRIGDVRGRGLMMGIEFVANSTHSSDLDPAGVPVPDGDAAAAVQLECFKRGLILERGGRRGAVVRFLPPLTITEPEVDECADVFEEAVEAAVASLSL